MCVEYLYHKRGREGEGGERARQTDRQRDRVRERDYGGKNGLTD